MKRISRRLLLTSVPALGVASITYARLIEPTWLELTRRTCPLANLRSAIELVHLSDLHASDVVPKAHIEDSVAMSVGLNPDLICITGDFVTHAKGFDRGWYVDVLRKLAKKAPTFAVLGNHDGGLWAAGGGGFSTTSEITSLLTESGISVLNNRSETVRISGQEVQMVGVGDLWAGETQPDLAFKGARPDIPTVVLSHNPDSKAVLGAHSWDLMLSGHTHGGQVVVPGLGINPAPVWDRAYIAGLNQWRGRWIHTSRGVGNVSGIRFNCRPEVTQLHLIGA